jgi:hypothetical protein
MTNCISGVTRTPIILFVLGTFVAVSASAQWLNYPTPGIPRTKDGKPNLTAPAPRTADGKPDLSALWDAVRHERSLMEDVSKSVEGGLPLQPWGETLLKARLANEDKDDPDGYCQPLGLVRMHLHPYPRKFIQLPGELVILFERDNQFRQIFTDGRPLPADPQPSYNGYSTGKWDGDTLVVQTTGFKDGMWLDNVGNPITSSAKVTERFRRLNFGNLEITMTVDDAKAYTKAWSVTVNYALAPDTDMLEFFCTENNLDIPHMVGK